MYICSYLLVLFSSSILALPNIVFVLTDDQDLLLNSVFINSPICCPSRSSILTGKYPHNINVYNNSVNGGCFGTKWRTNHELVTIATILKEQKNYTTFYGGKYLNQYNDVTHKPPGYDWWLGLKGNSKYYNYTLSINGTGRFFGDDYLTDVITTFALDFLTYNFDKHFLMMLAPPACHSPFTPAQRHQYLFDDVKTPRNIPFNVTANDKHWLVGMPPEALPSNVSYLDEIYKNRLRTLQSVDDLIQGVVEKLEEINVLDNTYIIFTSDNGFHIGQFTQPWDKRQPYESDIRVPFFMTGPKIPPKTLSNVPISAVDILPTILDLVGVKIDFELDGVSFKTDLFLKKEVYHKFILIEYCGEGDVGTIDTRCPWIYDTNLSECVPEAWCKCQDSRNNTYSCILDLSETIQLKFCVFEDGFLEIYDLVDDPHELRNIKLDTARIHYYKQLIIDMK